MAHMFDAYEPGPNGKFPPASDVVHTRHIASGFITADKLSPASPKPGYPRVDKADLEPGLYFARWKCDGRWDVVTYWVSRQWDTVTPLCMLVGDDVSVPPSRFVEFRGPIPLPE